MSFDAAQKRKKKTGNLYTMNVFLSLSWLWDKFKTLLFKNEIWSLGYLKDTVEIL